MSTIKVAFGGNADRWPNIKKGLSKAIQKVGLENVELFHVTDPNVKPSEVDYMICSPAQKNFDFTPYTGLKAALSMSAGVEAYVGNETLPHSVPLCRMLDPGTRKGMIEYAVGHTFRHHLALDLMLKRQANREWTRFEDKVFASERCVGILGFGRLGQAFGGALLKMNFRVLGWSRSEKVFDGVQCFHGSDGLTSVLNQSDILIVILPDTKEATNIINKETLSQCKPGVAIINVGRGASIDDEALLEALDTEQVSGATLDVFKKEPLPEDHKYWTHPKVFVTPHISAYPDFKSATVILAENIKRSENGESLMYLVDREKGY